MLRLRGGAIVWGVLSLSRGHDLRRISPAGAEVGGAALRFVVEGPEACEREAVAKGLWVLWPTQEASARKPQLPLRPSCRYHRVGGPRCIPPPTLRLCVG